MGISQLRGLEEQQKTNNHSRMFQMKMLTHLLACNVLPFLLLWQCIAHTDYFVPRSE